MARRPGPEVSIWAITDLDYADYTKRCKAEGVEARSKSKWTRPKLTEGGRSRPYQVRWKVAGKAYSKCFAKRFEADNWVSDLNQAHRNNEAFDATTGQPVSWLTTSSATVVATTDLSSASEVTFAVLAKQWFQEQWPTWAAKSRKNAAEILARACIILVTPEFCEPEFGPNGSKQARKARRRWLATNRRAVSEWLTDDHSEVPEVLQWSIRLTDMTAAYCKMKNEEIITTDRGRTMAAESIRRHLTTIKPCLEAGALQGLIEPQVWPKRPRARKKTTPTTMAGVHLVPTLAEGMAIIKRAVNHKPESKGYRVIFACILLAALRPGEARALYIECLNLPETGWGEARIDATVAYAGDRWTDGDEHFAAPKNNRIRIVPLPPELVQILRDHIGDRTSGLVVATRSGKPVGETNLSRAFARIRTSQDWTIYTLRHAAATAWLNAGMAVADIADRMGNSVEVVTSVYIGKTRDDREEGNRRAEAYFSQMLGGSEPAA